MEHTADPQCGGQHVPLCPTLPLTKESFSERPQGLNPKDKACLSSTPASSGPHMHFPVILHGSASAAVQQDCRNRVTSLREDGWCQQCLSSWTAVGSWEGLGGCWHQEEAYLPNNHKREQTKHPTSATPIHHLPR